ncbi:hypothetical protein DPMN_037416 [Dreissena polymorpha]|uniref:Uncharacterized protein n=1 Tax=Dreissena polymorpha TaxID=45954 RepID=A0A9D4MDG5_DREPO|nr:hypothetical protein DPMN_037416 [Dreissena polymorpha]
MVGGRALDVPSMHIRRSQRGRIQNDVYIPDSKQVTKQRYRRKLSVQVSRRNQ